MYQRQSLFGFPPPPGMPSTHTVRSIPLSQGLRPDLPWPLREAGSALSMSEFLPLDGKLVARSRLSSLNTVALIPSASGIAVQTYSLFNTPPSLWISGTTTHAILATSGGSISQASFVSANGFGSSALVGATSLYWQYAQIFSATLNENMLIAANSGQSLICLYQTGGLQTGKPLYSFLTGAPQAVAVDVFDNYLLAFNIRNQNAASRIQWCARGDPSNWTGEGSGFEDLLEMKGRGTAVRGTEDGRVYLFTTHEIWYGIRAAYPAQFQFFPYHSSVGCANPRTIQATQAGYLFLGSDRQLYLLPRGGGELAPIATSLTPILRTLFQSLSNDKPCWAVYDEKTHIYHLFAATSSSGQARGFVVNPATGEWGYAYDNGVLNDNGNGVCARTVIPNTLQPENLFFVSSEGTVYSTKSFLPADRPGSDSTATVTAYWQSTPLAADLPGSYKQVVAVEIDYQTTSRSTLTLKMSVDGGATYESVGQAVALPAATYADRARAEVYTGGAFPTLEISSNSPTFALHRLDVSLNLGGRR